MLLTMPMTWCILRDLRLRVSLVRMRTPHILATHCLYN